MPGAQITADPRVMMGKPVVAGTRITVESILERLAAGETVEQIVEAHPRLDPEGIRAALAVAARARRSRTPGNSAGLDGAGGHASRTADDAAPG